MNEAQFQAIYRELIEENPLAVRAVLKVLEIEFTSRVQTLAVTCEEKPRLRVNLDFLEEHCRTESFVKAVICHEFLHVLLRHTERFQDLTHVQNVACDAVINAILHRQCGPEYSGMMSEFYAEQTGIYRLLRPIERHEKRKHRSARGATRPPEVSFLRTWEYVYDGRLAVDDIKELLDDLGEVEDSEPALLLGGHAPGESLRREKETPLPPVLAEAVNRSLRSMNGEGIWRAPRENGMAAIIYRNAFPAADARVERWKRETFAVLERLLRPDAHSPRTRHVAGEYCLPVLSSSDRRAALRSLWSPFLPEALWQTQTPQPAGSAHVYLDVSGSMNVEMPLIIALLHRLRRNLRRPLWAFSDEVVTARIQDGKLLADTTGGTSMACVLEHLASARPPTALVVTDGYIEAVPDSLVRGAAATQLHALVTREGDATRLREAGIPYTQLGRLPQ